MTFSWSEAMLFLYDQIPETGLKYTASKLHLVTDHKWCVVYHCWDHPGILLMHPFGMARKRPTVILQHGGWISWTGVISWRPHGWGHFLALASPRRPKGRNLSFQQLTHTHMRTATKKHRFRHKIPNKLGIFKRV